MDFVGKVSLVHAKLEITKITKLNCWLRLHNVTLSVITQQSHFPKCQLFSLTAAFCLSKTSLKKNLKLDQYNMFNVLNTQ